MKLDEADRRRLRSICERYGIQRLEVFGSVARGTATPASDIDLLYSLKPGVELGWEIEDLTTELSELFGRPVDLVSRKSIHPLIRSDVLSQAQDFYAAT